jgi:uncharacterized protein (TIGR02453 family)
MLPSNSLAVQLILSFNMVAKSTFDFLKSLKKNNNKEWFDRNKDKYLAAKEDIENLVATLIKAFSKFDKKLAGLQPKDCTFRIYRDVRFSKDKRPYKTNMGASINPGGKKMEEAGFYLHIEPGQCLLAGGRWMPSADHLKMIRQEIDYNGKNLKKILNGKDFKKYYGDLDTEYKLSRPPKGYDKDHPDIELLKLNSYIAWHDFKDAEVLSKKFIAEAAKGAKIMKPFLDFLNTATS